MKNSPCPEKSSKLDQEWRKNRTSSKRRSHVSETFENVKSSLLIKNDKKTDIPLPGTWEEQNAHPPTQFGVPSERRTGNPIEIINET